MRLATAVTCVVLLGSMAGWVGAEKDDKQAKKLDSFWTHPDMANIPLRGIALLPTASYDNNLKTEKDVETTWGPASRSLGYRWYYSTLTKDLLRKSFGGDSVLVAVRNALLKQGRVDSLSARSLCQALRVSAVLSMRADLWEQTQVEWNQSGKPWTRVSLKSALIDSTGRLLWTASGSETVEGPQHNGESGTLGVKSSGLNLQQVSGDTGAPAFEEVLTRLFARWITNFPAKAAPAAAPASGGGS
jgi:hypothetical protein